MNIPENGIILVDKPAGLTSFGVVARIKRVLRAQAGKKVKVGHTGTLDPFATGLMILVTGTECRNAMHYTKLDKVYETTIILGQSSTTGDPEGEITKSKEQTAKSKEDITKVLAAFTGEIRQTPPIYSAIKINGQRAYKLARNGQAVEIPERTVTIFSVDLLQYACPALTIRAHVSSGTYIRTLAQDIGAALGTGAYCQMLRRIKIADYDIARARLLADYGITN